ncbi:hypothetical protein EVAR_66026_1 [Eumeta japonica]|uniref:Uncharacterized protein n=1 Tax=Eumeta variegata TaxID=151549 RepID=A0A4C1Z6H7_EUMVA|nr:hypothetical protein EVAR_66026_1 [Eumeta japonica]
MSVMTAVTSCPRRPANSSKSGALGNVRFARAALENRLLTRARAHLRYSRHWGKRDMQRSHTIWKSIVSAYPSEK